jgi:hypothetical protein
MAKLGDPQMRIAIVLGVAAASMSASANAQQAVQWKVSDGGNGHWYQRIDESMTWLLAQQNAVARGGHLATMTSSEENDFVYHTIGFFGLWLGGYQVPGSCEPGCGWRWVTDEPMTFTNWAPGEPNDAHGGERRLQFSKWSALWNDHGDTLSMGSVIEWSADCNNDGIVDYGQCRDGSLPDYNGNNIPDCCESGGACAAGSYPTQWRVEEGGNGHWYQAVIDLNGMNALQARAVASARGAKLFEGCGLELDWAYSHSAASSLSAWRSVSSLQHHGPYIGLARDSDGFIWPGGETCAFDRWDFGGEPTNVPAETAVMFFRFGVPPHNRCHDVVPSSVTNSALLEWSADCNNDGTVDYGQILQGQLADLDSDGIPDICQQPTCIDADIFRDFNVNGADLGILLSQWGPNTPLTRSDLNRDGVVDGSDLGIFLSFWGPCP